MEIEYRGKTLEQWREYIKKDKYIPIRSKKYIVILEELLEKHKNTGSPDAYEWHNFETGHSYVDYVPHNGQTEEEGYTKIALYKKLKP